MRPLQLFYLVSACFALLLGTLFKMQILDYEYYREQSERNRIRPVILEAPRGDITDRYGRDMLSNRLAFDCYIIPQEGKEYLEKTLNRISEILKREPELIMKRYKRRKRGSFTPVLLADNLSRHEGVMIEELSDALPGVFVKTRPVRAYTMGKASAHVLGYVGSLTPQEYASLKDYGYRKSDLIGKDGVEKVYDSYLRGRSGAVKYEADSHGRLLRVLSIQEPEEGKSIQLTLDLDLQQHVHEILKDRKGAVAVMELKHGGLLALVSSPAYDPNIFVQPAKSKQEISQVLVDENKPLMNRNIASEFPPGSTFKMITAHAALRLEKINTETEFMCPGYFMLGNHRFNNWNPRGHGLLDIYGGIMRSDNVFFWNLAMRLESDELVSEAIDFGLGERTGVDLPAERRGLVPDKRWKRKKMRQPWYRGDTLNMAIGQGALLTTPLQMLRATGLVASDGILFEPHVIKRINEIDVEPKNMKQVYQDDPHLEVIREGMRLVVEAERGTGKKARVDGVTMGGKTGTAQNPHGENHAWFVGFAPAENPKMSIVVLLENAGSGGQNAAPVAGQTVAWLKDHGYFR